MHVNVYVCVWGIWCHANRNWWEEVNKQGQGPLRKCTELEMDADNCSIRVLILLFEALLLFFSCQSDEWCPCVGQTPSPKTKHSSKNMVSVPLSSYKSTLYPSKNEEQHCPRQSAQSTKRQQTQLSEQVVRHSKKGERYKRGLQHFTTQSSTWKLAVRTLTNRLKLPFANQNIDCPSQKKLKWRIIGLTVGSGRYFQASFISQGMELERVMEEKLTKQGRDWYSLGWFRDVGPMWSSSANNRFPLGWLISAASAMWVG